MTERLMRTGKAACAPRSTVGKTRESQRGFKSTKKRSMTYICGVVEAHADVEVGDGLDLLLREVEVDVVQVLADEDGVGGLGDDDDALLGRPPEENLSRRALVRLRDGGDHVVLEQSGALVRALPVELAEGDGAE